jgi:CelD/BcsL family acetyltransferase involved in cellulose biosynthesis
MGEVTVRHSLYRPSQATIGRLAELKEQWLQANELSTVCDAAMLASLVNALDKLGALRVVTTECDGKLIAGSINAVHGGRLMAYFATYDPSVARASPGIMLMTDYIKWSLDNGIKEIDFLRGNETYKFEFATDSLILNSFVARKTLVGAAMLTAHRLWVNSRRQTDDKEVKQQPVVGSAYFTEKGNPREGLSLAPRAKETSDLPAA